jgi:hypothetical protein
MSLTLPFLDRRNCAILRKGSKFGDCRVLIFSVLHFDSAQLDVAISDSRGDFDPMVWYFRYRRG